MLFRSSGDISSNLWYFAHAAAAAAAEAEVVRSAIVLLALLPLSARASHLPVFPPPGLKIAFLGDQGVEDESEAVLQLLVAEGAEALGCAAPASGCDE